MIENKSGLHFAWYTMGRGSGLYFCSSTNNGGSFTERDSIRSKPSARHPQMALLPGGEMLIAWDETMQRGNTPSTRIGLQKRSVDGRSLFTTYITPDSLKATYPVLQAADSTTMIVAYDRMEGERSRVVYQRVSVKNLPNPL